VNRPLWTKSIVEARLLFLSCAAVLFAFCWIRVWLTTQIDMSRFQSLLALIPEQFQRLLPVPIDQLVSYPMRISLTYGEPLVFLVVTVWAVSRGSDSVSGELGRGTMEILLAQPLSRWQVLLASSTVTVVGAALLSLMAWAGTCMGVWLLEVKGPPGGEPTPMSELVDVRVFLPAIANLFAMGVFLGGLATLMSSWDRYRWRTIGLLAGFVVVSSILEIIAMTAENFKWFRWLTYFSVYEPERLVGVAVRDADQTWAWLLTDAEGHITDLGAAGCAGLLLALGLICFAAATAIFHRRDLPAPL